MTGGLVGFHHGHLIIGLDDVVLGGSYGLPLAGHGIIRAPAGLTAPIVRAGLFDNLLTEPNQSTPCSFALQPLRAVPWNIFFLPKGEVRVTVYEALRAWSPRYDELGSSAGSSAAFRY